MNYEGHFISDLHLFSRRSHAHLHRTDIFDAAARANVFVFGGDIFDFKWSTLGSVETTAAAAADWLRELVTPHGGCEFHFILGNHSYRNYALFPISCAIPSATRIQDFPVR